MISTTSRGLARATGRWLGIFLVAACCAGVANERQAIDPNHLTIGFLVEHVGYAKVLGLFQEATGEFSFDEQTAEIRDVRVVVKTDSVFTNQPDRDRHLRSSDFLNVELYPEMIFESAGTKLEDRRGVLSGQLTLLGQTRPLALDVSWNKTADSPMGEGPLGTKPRITGMSARGTVKRSEFGMTYGVADALVGDEIELIIELESRSKE